MNTSLVTPTPSPTIRALLEKLKLPVSDDGVRQGLAELAVLRTLSPDTNLEAKAKWDALAAKGSESFREALRKAGKLR